MPQAMPSDSYQPSSSIPSEYPVTTKQAEGVIHGIPTEVRTTYFSDKIMVTISQEGRLAQWVRLPIFLLPFPSYSLFPSYSSPFYLSCQRGSPLSKIHVPLEASSSTLSDLPLPSTTDEDSLLPMPHLTPKTLLGGSTAIRETTGQLYATQIASTIATRNPQETRTVLLGLGLSNSEANQEVFYDTMDLVHRCL